MQALYEAGRQDEIVQETRGWDESKQSTFSQRSKENANDYRYFPDPDLPKMKLHSVFNLVNMKAALPELPWEKRLRYAGIGLKPADIEVFVQDKALADYFEKVITDKDAAFAQVASNYLINDLKGELPASEHFIELIGMVVAGEVTSRGAKDLLAMIITTPASPKALAAEHGLIQQNNEDALKPIIQEIIDANEKIVADYKSGKEAALQGLIGQVMKASNGSANPAVAMKLLKELLS